MNLLTDPWISATRNNDRTLIRVAEIADPRVSDLAYDRPELQIAIYELLVGILAMSIAQPTDDAWKSFRDEPPTVDELQSALTPYAEAFELLGGGPRFMQFPIQDTDLKKASPISRLYLGAATENGEKKSLDLIVHSQPGLVISQAEAVAALYAHQVRLPGSGAGHKASARGGDHYTMLVHPKLSPGLPALWAMIWENTPHLERGPLDPNDLAGALPWMRPMAHLTKGDLGPADHQSRRPDIEVFFAASRRFWLLENANGEIEKYASRTKGFTYVGWDHPLSPSSVGKKGRRYHRPSVYKSKLNAALAGSAISDNEQPPRELPALARFRALGNGNTAPGLTVATQIMDNADVMSCSLTRDVHAPGSSVEIEAIETAQQIHLKVADALKFAFSKLQSRPNDLIPAFPVETAITRLAQRADAAMDRARSMDAPATSPEFLDDWRRTCRAVAIEIFEKAFGSALLRAPADKQAEIGKFRRFVAKSAK